MVIDDLIRCLGLDPAELSDSVMNLGEDEKRIYAAVQRYNGATPDRIAEDTGMTVASVNAMVTVLEIKGFVQTYAGRIYAAV